MHLKKEIQIACNTNIGCTNVDIFFTFVSEFEENATLQVHLICCGHYTFHSNF